MKADGECVCCEKGKAGRKELITSLSRHTKAVWENLSNVKNKITVQTEIVSRREEVQKCHYCSAGGFVGAVLGKEGASDGDGEETNEYATQRCQEESATTEFGRKRGKIKSGTPREDLLSCVDEGLFEASGETDGSEDRREIT